MIFVAVQHERAPRTYSKKPNYFSDLTGATAAGVHPATAAAAAAAFGAAAGSRPGATLLAPSGLIPPSLHPYYSSAAAFPLHHFKTVFPNLFPPPNAGIAAQIAGSSNPVTSLAASAASFLSQPGNGASNAGSSAFTPTSAVVTAISQGTNGESSSRTPSPVNTNLGVNNNNIENENNNTTNTTNDGKESNIGEENLETKESMEHEGDAKKGDLDAQDDKAEANNEDKEKGQYIKCQAMSI